MPGRWLRATAGPVDPSCPDTLEQQAQGPHGHPTCCRA